MLLIMSHQSDLVFFHQFIKKRKKNSYCTLKRMRVRRKAILLMVAYSVLVCYVNRLCNSCKTRGKAAFDHASHASHAQLYSGHLL